jgi:hypothetical protein
MGRERPGTTIAAIARHTEVSRTFRAYRPDTSEIMGHA